MAKLLETTEAITEIDEDGNERSTIKTTTKNISKIDEPEYIKIYTQMWADFHDVPPAYHALFYELAKRMTYCDATDLDGSQIVHTGKPNNDSILKALGWKQNMLQKGLAVLVKCGAIRRIARGVYQINPTYAGKGEWKYNPKLKQGGIEDLVASFHLGKNGEKEWKSKIVWADDGTDTDYNDMWREGLKVKPDDNAMLKDTTLKAIS